LDWWQVVLIILASIIGGLLVGSFVSLLILRLVRLIKKPAERLEPVPATEPRPKPAAFGLLSRFRKKPSVIKYGTTLAVEDEAEEKATSPAGSDVLAEYVTRQETASVVEDKVTEGGVIEDRVKFAASGLLTEVEYNRRIATASWTGKLLPFQTHVWDANRDEVNALPTEIREALTQAYVDMRLANSIVWLSTEFDRRNQNLDENYMKLRTNIAAALDKIAPLLKWAGV